MLIVCKKLPQPAGTVTDISEDLQATTKPFFPVTIGKTYRPLALSIRSRVGEVLEVHALIKADKVEEEKNLSIYYENLELFSILDKSIDPGWTVLRQVGHLIDIGAPIIGDVDLMHDLLRIGDVEAESKILHWTSHEKIR